ncbi:MAG: amidohydrolase family protein [Gammaproteobacteria bacterium]|jgi:N-acyl-D-amino-acid deacylase|nr:amidohydrolase family protein [Gammaproteobacteria bacterium]
MNNVNQGLRNFKIIVVSILVLCISACSDPVTYDLILRGGTIVDGSGGEAYQGDIALNGGEIAAIGDLVNISALSDIDVSGLVVAPGFINIHSHGRGEALPTAVNMISQGITTEIMNSDGYSPVDLNAQFDSYIENGLALNVGGFIGFNSVWAEVVGIENTRPTQAQINQMQNIIRAGLEAGAWGVSAGLDYVPGYYATTEEVIQILEPFSAWDVVFTNHDRVTPESGYSSITGMTETITIGEATGLVPLVTHMKVQGWEQGRAAEILEAMRVASTSNSEGAVADVYPYLAGQTEFSSLIIPSWALAGGRDAMLERFQDSDLRARIITEAEESMDLRWGGASGVLVGGQQELTDIMNTLGTDSHGEAVVRILEEADNSVILRFGSEEDLIEVMQHPSISIACDCDAANEGENVHPRYWGTFPKVLGEYVREKGVLTLENAIYKMTALPAKTIGMKDRGLLKPGMAADIVVFDSETIIDHATFENPTARPDGIVSVILNGEFAYIDGAVTGIQTGVVLNRDLPL